MHKKCGRFLKPAERAACFVCARLEGKDKFVGGYLGGKIVSLLMRSYSAIME